jgi:hypothetical protein
MAKKMRLTQEEEVIRLLKREGFREVSPQEVNQEPYKSLAKLPDCFESHVQKSSARRKTV